MLYKPKQKNLEIQVNEKKEEYQQNKKRLEKLNLEILEFELQRSHDDYLLTVDRFKSLKDNARFHLGVVGLIGTVVITLLFSIVGMNQIFETSIIKHILLFWGIIFIMEISWLLSTPFWIRRTCNQISLILQKMPKKLKSISDEGYNKREVIIQDIAMYKYKSDISECIFDDDDFDRLDNNERLIYKFIKGTIFAIYFFFTGVLLGVIQSDNTSIITQVIKSTTIILIFYSQLSPVLSAVYNRINRK